MFDNMLVKYQKKVIPLYEDGLSNLTSDQQNAVSELHNFFWGLCLIVGMADTVLLKDMDRDGERAI